MSATVLDGTATRDEILADLQTRVAAPAGTGYLVQLPLPGGLDTGAVPERERAGPP